jgi:hypothetical protein
VAQRWCDKPDRRQARRSTRRLDFVACLPWFSRITILTYLYCSIDLELKILDDFREVIVSHWRVRSRKEITGDAGAQCCAVPSLEWVAHDLDAAAHASEGRKRDRRESGPFYDQVAADLFQRGQLQLAFECPSELEHSANVAQTHRPFQGTDIEVALDDVQRLKAGDPRVC